MGILTSSLVVSLRDRASGPARGIMRSLGLLKREANGFGAAQSTMMAPLGGTLRNLAMLGAGYVGVTQGLSGTIGAAIKFEDAMADIRKVIDFKSPQQFEGMRQDILKMSTTLPITAEGIAAIMAAAGQANIPTQELNRFTEMTAKVSTAWDVSAGETGEALAKMKTALGLTVGETSLLADAINHLSNNSASSAPNLLRFSRGLSSGAMAGFKAKESLAFGGAMIGAGFEAEVAETSFRNMAKALTSGSTATKSQRMAFRSLGLDARKVARAMQKDAVGTTLKVFEKINDLPKHQQGAISTMLFGSEARALPGLINNMDELRRMLGLVASDTAYAGSASREFEEASKRTSNALQKLKNSVSAIGVGLGDMALPTIAEWANDLAYTLNTLDKRVTVFDRLGAGVEGFMSGLGLEGGSIAEQFGQLYDGIFGRLDTFEADTDRLGRIFLTFREWGSSVRAFGQDVGESIGAIERFFGLDAGTIGETLGSLAGHGATLAASAIGISLVAGALMQLAKAAAFLTGITTAVGIVRTLGKLGLGAMLFGGGAAAAGAAGASAATTTVAAGGAGAVAGAAGKRGAMGMVPWMFTTPAGWATLAGLVSAGALISSGEADPSLRNPERKVEKDNYYRQFHGMHFEGGRHRAGMGAGPQPGDDARTPQQQGPQQKITGRTMFLDPSFWLGKAAESGFDFRDHMRGGTGVAQPVTVTNPEALRGDAQGILGGLEQSGTAREDMSRDVSLIGTPTVIAQPAGVQQVQVTNPTPVHAPISVSVTVQATSNADPAAIGRQVADQVGQKIKSELAGLQADRTWGVA